MWLHRAPVNAARESSGRRRVSTLWLWGGGVSPGATTTSSPRRSLDVPTLHGDDPWLAALAAHIGAPIAAVPMEFGRVSFALPAVVELTPMIGGPKDGLLRLAKHWFAPLRSALTAGTLDSFDLVANDVRFRVGARPAWRIWRRRASWLAVLRRRDAGAKA
jgi:hypothetical protein